MADRKDNARRHVQGKHLKSVDIMCPLCQKVFHTPDARQKHVKNEHNMKLSMKQLREMDIDMTKSL